MLDENQKLKDSLCHAKCKETIENLKEELKYLKQSTPIDNLKSSSEIKKISRKRQVKQIDELEDNINCQPDNSVTVEAYKKGAMSDPLYFSCLSESIN